MKVKDLKSMDKEINSHMPDKYCPACGAIWIPDKVLEFVPTCQCSCVAGAGTIRYNPVCKNNLQVKPRITKMARKYMDCPFPPEKFKINLDDLDLDLDLDLAGDSDDS